MKSPAPKDRHGFTLIEFIGVLAILAIAAAIITPSIVRRIDEAARTRERSDAATIKDALRQSVLRNRTVPAYGTMPTAAAADLVLPLASITNTPRRTARAFVVDPALTLGTGLPYTQGAAGLAAPPTNARMVLVSSVGRPLPIAGGVSGSAADFNALWNAAKDSVPGGSAWSTWTGRGEDLVIERLDFGKLFHKIVLVNADVSGPGQYSIDNFGMANVPGLSRVVTYLLKGTPVSLYRPDTALDVREIVREDASYVYQNRRWGRRLSEYEDVIDTFGSWVDEFLKPPAPTDPKFAATQRAVVDAFYNYLWGYGVWAFGDPNAVPLVPPFAGSAANNTPQYPSYTVVYDSQAIMATFTDNLIH